MDPLSSLRARSIDKLWQVWLLKSIRVAEDAGDLPQSDDLLIHHYVKAFENLSECEQFIHSITNYDRFIFIVDEFLGEQILPQIHELEQLYVFYVYRTQQQSNASWFKPFSKFRGVRMQMNQDNDSNQRHDKGRTQTRARPRSQAKDLFSFNILNNNAEQDRSTAELDGHFVHSQLLIDCLQRMKSASKEVEEFIQSCREHKDFKENEARWNTLEEFQKEYASDKSVRWYTKDSFVYRMLNKALRIQNIDTMFMFRFFIRDLGQQLKDNQWSKPGSVYRGQSLSKSELKALQQSVGTVISINSFLSTTLYRAVADIYIGEGSDDLEKVLFKINFDPSIDGIKPFADVTLLSQYPQEGEILFMLGSIFRIDEITCDENGIWIIELNLCSDHDRVLKPIFRFLRQEANRCELDLLAFGNVLHDMGEFDAAKRYYQQCLNILPADDQIWKSYCYYLLGLIATKDGEDKEAFNLLNQSLVIRSQILPSSDPSIADTKGAMARLCFINSQFDEALKLYRDALMIFHNAFTEDDLTSAMTYTNIAVVCNAQKKYSEALDNHLKALAIRKKHLPSDHFRFGTSYNNFGEVYQGLGKNDVALEYYKLAQKVFKKSLPSRHIDKAILSVNISSIFAIQGRFAEVLTLNKTAFAICRSIWSTENLHLSEIERLISNAEKLDNADFFGPLETIWTELFRPFKCIASLDPRTSYRNAFATETIQQAKTS